MDSCQRAWSPGGDECQAAVNLRMRPVHFVHLWVMVK
jgi:hypothetical protein